MPQPNYTIDFLELSKTEEYKNYKVVQTTELGDTVIVRHLKLDLDLELEVIKTTKNILTGRLDKVELGSLKKTLATSFTNTATTIQDVTTRVANLEATSAQVVNGVIVNGTIDATKINDLLNILIPGDATQDIYVDTITANIGTFNDLFAKNITADNIKADTITANEMVAKTITAESGIIADLAVGDAQISHVSAVKVDTGSLDTSKVDIASADGRLLITDNTIYDYINNDLMQPFLRVQTGRIWDVVNRALVPRKDAGGNYVYGFEVRDKTGQSTMIDGEGVHNEGITPGAVDNSKISPTANIDGAKLDIASVVTEINNGTETITGSKIYMDNKTLDVSFSQLNSTVNSQGSAISSQASAISSNTSAISANANSISLRVTSETYNAKMGDIDSSFSGVSSVIDILSTGISSKVAKDGVISSINQSAETITIDAANLNLSGFITATNLSTSGQTVINGGNITTGTIDASKISVSNGTSSGCYVMDNAGFRQIGGFNLSALNTLNCAYGQQFNINYSSGADLVIGSGSPGTKGRLICQGWDIAPGMTVQASIASITDAIKITGLNNYGYIQIGCLNESYAHIYTGTTGGFYFNHDLHASGFVNTSDRNLKENIGVMDSAESYDTIKSLNTYNYNYIGDEKIMLGIMADETPLEAADQFNFLGVNVYSLLTLTISALKESMNKVEILEAENDDLETKYESLLARIEALEMK